MIFEVLMLVTMKSILLLDLMPCSLVKFSDILLEYTVSIFTVKKSAVESNIMFLHVNFHITSQKTAALIFNYALPKGWHKI